MTRRWATSISDTEKSVPITAMVPHVFLAGRTVSEDWELIRALKSDHIITLLESFDLVRLVKSPLLKSATLIVVDCSGQEKEATRTLKAIKMICKRFQRPTAVLVDGQLDQLQVAQAFRTGVRDYFRSPYGARLLAERISTLCRYGPV